MKLNCKPGDLAVVIKGRNAGKFCTCIRLATRDEAVALGYLQGQPMWQTDTMLKDNLGGEDLLMFDHLLRPIRDNDGEDETLQWLEVPRKVAA